MVPSIPLPTNLLPRLPRSLSQLHVPTPTPSTHLLSLLKTLSELYPTHSTDSGYNSANEEDEEFIDKDDVFERQFATEWTLILLRRSEEWVEEGEQEGESEEEMNKRRNVVEEAARLVALLSETSRSGPILRPLSIPVSSSLTPSEPLQITLHDALPSSTDATSVGLQSWGSSILLSHQIALDPAAFGIVPVVGKGKKRVLELGAGTGLLSIVWALLSQRVGGEGETEIIATDFHPDVLLNLARNLSSNFPLASDPAAAPVTLTSTKLDWSALHTSLSFSNSSHSSKLSLPPPFSKENDFDTIVGADIVYSSEHSEWLKSVVEWGLRKPSSGEGEKDEGGVFHLIVPLRDHHREAIKTITTVFPFASLLPEPTYATLPPKSQSSSTTTSPSSSRRSSISTNFITRPVPVLSLSSLDIKEKEKEKEKGERIWRLAIRSEEEVKRVKGVGRADEAGYKRFVLGWC